MARPINPSNANLGFEAKLWQMADALRNNMDAAEYMYPDLKADYLLANPPFNGNDWRGELLKDNKRWVYDIPPAGNTNDAWMQHIVHHLALSSSSSARTTRRLGVV